MATAMKAVQALDRRFDVPAVVTALPQVRERRMRGVRVGTLCLLVAHDCGGEILDAPRVRRLPLMPSWCSGLINVRGQLIPAFDLHACLDMAQQRATRQWWLVLGGGESAVAFPIDALPQSLLLSQATSIQTLALPERLQPHVVNGFRIDGELWFEFRHLEFFKSLRYQNAA